MSGIDNTSIIPAVVGPTAVGKTAVAIRIAEQLNGEIVSADSRQVYKGMAIGAGAPSKAELNRIRHHLIAEIEPDVRISAGEFARMARGCVDSIIERGKLPVFVGGSGLYIRALVDGLSPLPSSDSNIRAEITSEIEQRGMYAMIEELVKVDPQYAGKVGIHDSKRLVRALEVWRLTGRSFSDWHSDGSSHGLRNVLFLGLTRPRRELWELIEKRVRMMVESGWIDEIKILTDRFGGYDRLPMTVTEGIGYSELIAYINGDYDLEACIEKIVISTRQFAKRQLTWFKADSRVMWCEQAGSQAVDYWVEWSIEQFHRCNRNGVLSDLTD